MEMCHLVTELKNTEAKDDAEYKVDAVINCFKLQRSASQLKSSILCATL